MDEPLTSSLPEGRYLSAVGGLRLGKGGQTAAMLTRSRILSETRGEPVDILTFDPRRGYTEIRSRLLEAGQISEHMRILNLYEHYRNYGWGEDAGTGEGLGPVRNLRPHEVTMTNGAPWKTQYLDSSGTPVLTDYQRADGSTYLRAATYDTKAPETLATTVTRVAPDGEIVGRYARVNDLYRRWITDLTRLDAQTFLFMDSRYLVPIITPLPSASIHLIYVLHNCHLPYPRRWSTSPRPDYARFLQRMGDLSAVVTLTERQRADIARAWGDRSNLAVVSNPVETPAHPVPLPRDPRRVVMVGRLENQKRFEHALLSWTRVVREVPDAHLDIYGTGSREGQLRALMGAQNLEGSVSLRGFDPDAREQFWTASAALLTSRYEGYPLAILESMARGCPVVSYDVPYGPREQIDDGGNGFLVPDGNFQAAASAVVQLLQSPALVEKLGSSARSWAAKHDCTQFVADWARVLRGIVERSASQEVDMSHPEHAAGGTQVVVGRTQILRPAPLTHQRTRVASTLRQHIASWRMHR